MVKNEYSKKIRMARQEAGLTQKELADKLGTKQQNVGRWENGVMPTGNYREKLDNLLGINGSNEANDDAHALHKTLYMPLRALPLAGLGEYEFEEFCAELLHYMGHKNAIRYGKRGDKQDGIDVCSMDEHEVVIQCKNVKEFDNGDAKSVIEKYTMGGRSDKQKVLAITIRVGVRVIDTMKKAGWVIWDPEIITSIVRNELSDIQKRNLVETYFNNDGEILKNCLGLKVDSSFTDVNTHFNNIAKGMLMYDNDYCDTEGDFVIDVRKALMNDESSDVIVISGVGGVGKTRRLKEIASGSKKEMALLKDGQTPSGKEIGELLRDDAIIVIDDAHRMLSQLRICLSEYMDQDIKNKKMIILTREYAKAKVMEMLVGAGVPTDFVREYTVKKLKDKDAFGLAAKILGEDNPYLSQLVNISGGNALLLVTGCKLLKERGVLPAKMLGDNDGNMSVGRIFGAQFDEMFGQEKEKCPERDLLGLISVIQPCTEFRLLEMARGLFGNYYNEIALRRAVQRLFDLGFVKGNKLHVVPDLLADYECEKMLLEKNGNDVGVLEGILDLMSDCDTEIFGNILRNISQLDWRTDMMKGANLLKRSLWKRFERKFKDADINMRGKMLEILYETAYYSPEEVLKMVNLVMDDTVKNASIVWRLPRILEAVAYNGQFLELVLEQLVKLATIYCDWNDKNSPYDVMKNIARFELYKPVYYAERTTDFILEKGFIKNFPFSPYGVLEECLKTDGSSMISRGKISMEIRQFRVKAESVRGFRRKIIGRMIKDINSNNVQNAIAAAGLMRRALCVPDNGGWNEEREWMIGEFLDKIEYNTMRPMIGATIRSKLDFMVRRDDDKGVEKIIGRIQEGLEYELARSIVDAWGHDTFIDDDYKKAHSEYVVWIRDLAKNLVKVYDCHSLLALIIAYLDDAENDKAQVGEERAGNILKSLCDESEEFCRYFVDAILDQKIFKGLIGDPLTSLVRVHNKVEDAMGITESILEYEDCVFLRSVAFFITMNIDVLPLTWMATVLGKLVEDNDDSVKRAVVEALKYLPKTHSNLAVNLVNAIKIKHDNIGVLKAVEEITDSSYGIISVNDLTDEIVDRTMEVLLHKVDLDYGDVSFLQRVAGRSLGKVVDMMINRIVCFRNGGAKIHDGWYSPVPFMGRIEIDREKEIVVLSRIWKKIDETRKKTNDEIDEFRFFGPRLIAFFNISQKSLLGYITDISLAESDAEVVKIFMKALPLSFLWDIDCTDELVRSVSNVMSQEKIINTLFGLIFDADGGTYGRTIGQPGPFEVELKNKSTEMLQKSRGNCLLRELYVRINKYAESEIDRQKKSDEELL